MPRRRKTTISDVLGWLAGIGCIILSIIRNDWGEYPQYGQSQIGIGFGILLIMLTSWIRKTRNKASDDMDKMNGAATDNPPPQPIARKMGHFFGIALIMLTSWTRMIRDDANDDHDKAERAAAEAERVRQVASRERKLRKMSPASAASSYSILELNENATDMEIKRAFRKLVKRYHPDRSRYSASANAEKFRQVQEAYAVLRDHRGFSHH